jgi:hypothetical protein
MQHLGQSSDPKENTGVGYLRRLHKIAEGVATMLVGALRQVERETARMEAAEARLADANKLLWMWVAGEFPEGMYSAIMIDTDDEDTARVVADYMLRAGQNTVRKRIVELATILGEDVSPENVQHMLQQRASSEA